jgi:uncharacterized protein (DUF2147 family)
MKRFAGLMMLMALSTPAYAGSYSFVIGERHIHVEASRHCRSLSCVSWSEITRKRDRDDKVATGADPAPAQTPAAAQPAAPVPQPPLAPVQAQPAPLQQQASAGPALKPAETRSVVVTPPAKIDPPAMPAVQAKPDVKVEATVEAKVEPKVEPKVDANAEAKPRVDFDLKPAVVAKSAPSKTTLQSEGEAVEAPIGDWQTEGRKGLVRIEPCGTALCGYMINTSTYAKGETVLINMKPKANSEWSGSIYSRASANTYYATMTMKRPNTLRVEACVVGHYFCSGNNWTRIAPRPDDTISPRETREASADPAR